MLAAENRSMPHSPACKRERTRLGLIVTCKQFLRDLHVPSINVETWFARDVSQRTSRTCQHVSTTPVMLKHKGLIEFKKRIRGSCTTSKSRQIWGCKIDAAVWRVETSLRQPQSVVPMVEMRVFQD
jgi:hypothetical protein